MRKTAFTIYSVGQFFWADSLKNVTKNWFQLEDIKQKRRQIATLIEALAQEEHPGGLRLPELQFTAPVRRTSGRRKKEKLTQDPDVELKEDPPALSERLTRQRPGRSDRQSEATVTSVGLESQVNRWIEFS